MTEDRDPLNPPKEWCVVHARGANRDGPYESIRLKHDDDDVIVAYCDGIMLGISRDPRASVSLPYDAWREFVRAVELMRVRMGIE